MDNSKADEIKSPKLVKAIYNFKGSNNDELCFHKDDIITLTQTPEGGWWEGTFNSVTGWFPSNYVEPTQIEDKIDENFIVKDYEIHQYRNMVFKDIVDTEAAYLKDLQEALNKYLLPLQLKQILPDQEIGLIIRNIQEICSTHGHFLSSLAALNPSNSKDLRIGGVFLDFASQIKKVHTDYCNIHAKFVHLIELHKKELCNLFNIGMDKPSGTVQLTTYLSISFRRLDKYPALLQELQRYTDESHSDRGDTQRAGFVYREISMSCLELRRQKEMELEVMLGNIKKWEGNENIESFGEIIKMGPVSVQHLNNGNEIKKDRYIVLFAQHLLILSVSSEMNSFVLEAKCKLEDLFLTNLNDEEKSKFELEMRDKSNKYIIHCTCVEETKTWTRLIQKCQVSAFSSKQQAGRANTPMNNSMFEFQRKMQSSSISDSSSNCSNAILTTPQRTASLRNRFCNSKSLLPHPPIRISINSTSSHNSSQTDKNTLEKSTNKHPDDDMIILQVIESYCFTSKNRKVINSANEQPHILVEEEDAKDESFETQNNEEKSVIEIVLGLQNEIKQLKQDVKLLTDGLLAERKARKKLKVIFHGTKKAKN